MAEYDDKPQLLIKKLGGLVALILGFLIAASGYRYGYPGLVAVGIAFVVVGLVLLVLKIVRRNQG